MSEPKLSPSVKSEFKKWRRDLKLSAGSKEDDTTRTATDLHVHLKKFPELALMLHFLKEEKISEKHIIVGKALGEYFTKYLGLSVEEFEKMIKPTLTLKDIKGKVKEFCEVVICPETISKVIYHDWKQEKKYIQDVRVFVKNTLEFGFTDITKLDLEKVKKLQAKKHYGLFGKILDFYDTIGIEFFNKVYHEEKTHRKFSKLIQILSKAEKIVTEIQLSVESYLKGKT